MTRSFRRLNIGQFLWPVTLMTLPLVAAIFLGMAYRIWSLLPIYPDEIAHRIAVGRLIFDQFSRINSIPGCLTSATLNIPYVLYPAGFVFSTLSLIRNMTDNRIVAALILAACIALLYRAGRYLTDQYSAVLGLSLTLIAISVGVIPAGLIVLRAEYIIGLFFCFALFGICSPRNARTDILFASIGVLLFSMALFAHPKTIYFLPLAVILLTKILWYRGPYFYASGLILLGLIAFYAIGFAMKSFDCPELPEFNAALAGYNIHPVMLLQSPREFVAAVWSVNFQSFQKLTRIMLQATFQGASEVAYLPPVPQARLVRLTNFLISAFVIQTLVVMAGVVLSHLCGLISNWRNRRDRATFLVQHAGMLLAYFGTTTSLLLNKTQHWYDVSFWISLYLFSIFVSFMIFFGTRDSIAAPSVKKTCLPSSIFRSKPLIALIFAPTLVAAALSEVVANRYIYPAFAAGYSGPGISIAHSDWKLAREQTLQALKKCNLSIRSPRLIVDDLTYPIVQRSFGVMPITYGMFMGAAPFIAKAREIGSAGLIVRCDGIPSGLPALPWDQVGSVCCASLK